MSDYITGMDDLLKKLSSLKKTEAKKAIRKGTRAGAKIVQEIAKRNAPRNTGALAQQIKVRAMKRSRVWTGATATTQIFYGSFNELGTKRQKANDFLRRAAEQARTQATNTAMEIIKQEIEKI